MSKDNADLFFCLCFFFCVHTFYICKWYNFKRFNLLALLSILELTITLIVKRSTLTMIEMIAPMQAREIWYDYLIKLRGCMKFVINDLAAFLPSIRLMNSMESLYHYPLLLELSEWIVKHVVAITKCCSLFELWTSLKNSISGATSTIEVRDIHASVAYAHSLKPLRSNWTSRPLRWFWFE